MDDMILLNIQERSRLTAKHVRPEQIDHTAIEFMSQKEF